MLRARDPSTTPCLLVSSRLPAELTTETKTKASTILQNKTGARAVRKDGITAGYASGESRSPGCPRGCLRPPEAVGTSAVLAGNPAGIPVAAAGDGAPVATANVR